MRFLDRKTDGGRRKGKIAFYCSVLHISRQGFYCFLKHRDTYGRSRMHDAPKLKYPEAKIPGERSVYRIMDGIGLRHRAQRKANGITKTDKNARKSDDLLKRNFRSEKPLKKCVTDITEIPTKDGKLYASGVCQRKAFAG